MFLEAVFVTILLDKLQIFLLGLISDPFVDSMSFISLKIFYLTQTILVQHFVLLRSQQFLFV